MLGDASDEDGIDLQLLADLRGFVLLVFEAEDGAAGHDAHVRQFGKCTDEIVGYTFAKEIIVGVAGRVNEWKHGDGANLLRVGAAKDEGTAGCSDDKNGNDGGNPDLLP